jgi:hypothetical protein
LAEHAISRPQAPSPIPADPTRAAPRRTRSAGEEYTKAEVLKIRAIRDAMDDKQRAKFDLDWAREMDGQFFGCAPCVPYDDDSTDVLHLCLNSFGSATLECFDRHLPATRVSGRR